VSIVEWSNSKRQGMCMECDGSGMDPDTGTSPDTKVLLIKIGRGMMMTSRLCEAHAEELFNMIGERIYE